MLDELTTVEIIKLIAPLIIIQLSLAIFCIQDILRKGTRSWNKVVWIIICAFFNLIGPLVYFIFGKTRSK